MPGSRSSWPNRRIDRVEWARDREGVYADRLADRLSHRGHASPANGKPWPRPKIEAAPHAEGNANGRAIAGLPPEPAAEWRAAQRGPGADAGVCVPARRGKIYAGTFAAPQPVMRLHRGEVMQPREEVAPGHTRFNRPADHDCAERPEAERRMALAKWLGEPAHPLTSRVMVNRIWHYHFGRGLVRTPSDFGFGGGHAVASGAARLAGDRVRRAWLECQGYLHRLIMLSSVYRQASRPGEASRRGRRQRAVWRFRPRRLEAEAIHDAILSVAACSEPDAGGPGYEVFVPEHQQREVYEPRPSLGPAEWRRMIYQSKPRMRHGRRRSAFSIAPTPVRSMARRNVSTTALQVAQPAQQADSCCSSRSCSPIDSARSGPATSRRRSSGRSSSAFARLPDAEELGSRSQLVVAEQGLVQLCRAICSTPTSLCI